MRQQGPQQGVSPQVHGNVLESQNLHHTMGNSILKTSYFMHETPFIHQNCEKMTRFLKNAAKTKTSQKSKIL